MNKLRLAQLLPTLERYENKFTKGPYKNGNIISTTIKVTFDGTFKEFDANDFPRELLERPWYVRSIYPVCKSSYMKNVNVGLSIYLDKEENEYV